MPLSNTIYIVEDDADDRLIMQQAFQAVQFTGGLQLFPTSESFLKHMEALPDAALPALVVLDFNMPGLNGGELLSALRRDARYRDIPVVLYSTGMRPLLKELLLSTGATECFDKGMTYNDYLRLATRFKQLALEGQAQSVL